MLTMATFATGPDTGPTFTGVHDPRQRWGECRWATPRFDREQIDLIMRWLTESHEDECLLWDGEVLVHDPGIPSTGEPDIDAAPKQVQRLDPDSRGRYRVGLRRWTWRVVAPAAARSAATRQNPGSRGGNGARGDRTAQISLREPPTPGVPAAAARPSSPPAGLVHQTSSTGADTAGTSVPTGTSATGGGRRRGSGRKRRRGKGTPSMTGLNTSAVA